MSNDPTRCCLNGQCPDCKRQRAENEKYLRNLNHRPESYSTKGPAVVGKSWSEARADSEEWGAPKRAKLSVEQVHAELRRLSSLAYVHSVMSSEVKRLIDQLPRPDVVEECVKSFKQGCEAARCSRFDIQRALRRFCELEGIPVPKYLEGK